jgi:hypothetical protein
VKGFIRYLDGFYQEHIVEIECDGPDCTVKARVQQFTLPSGWFWAHDEADGGWLRYCGDLCRQRGRLVEAKRRVELIEARIRVAEAGA